MYLIESSLPDVFVQIENAIVGERKVTQNYLYCEKLIKFL